MEVNQTNQAMLPRSTEFYVAAVSDKRGIGRDKWFMDDEIIEGYRRYLWKY